MGSLGDVLEGVEGAVSDGHGGAGSGEFGVVGRYVSEFGEGESEVYFWGAVRLGRQDRVQGSTVAVVHWQKRRRGGILWLIHGSYICCDASGVLYILLMET